MNVKIKACAVTVSDSRALENDVSGDALVGLLNEIGAEIVERKIVTDDLENLKENLLALILNEDINLIVTTGGTGFSSRDNTPEATLAVIEKEARGLAEAMRTETMKKTPLAILSRGVCGIGNRTLIINLPGSPKGVRECFEIIKPVIQHAVNLICGETEH